VDGQWSEWEAWGKCDCLTYDSAIWTTTRTRTCTAPKPENGGYPCSGWPTEETSCRNETCVGMTSTITMLQLNYYV
jgi:hypothetical protein